MKKIYVSHSNTDKETERRDTVAFCKYVRECGELPIAPCIYLPAVFGEENADRGFSDTARLLLLLSCDELWYFGDSITREITDEICFAMNKGKRVRYITRNMFERYIETTEVHNEKV